MTLRGEIEAFPLETVVQMIHSTNKTGQLEVRGADNQGGTLGFDGGRLVAAVAGEDVGEPALGAVFAVESGSFEFIPWGDAPGANLSGDLNQLLDKAVEERDRLVAIRKIVPDDRSRFRLSERAADKGDITLTSDQWRTLLAVNGERDVPGVADHLKAGKTATRASLATLVDAGFIDVLEPAAAAPPAPAAPAQAPASEQWSPPAPVQEWVAPTPEVQPDLAWAPPTPEPQAEPARPSWEQQTPAPQTWEQQRSIGPAWEPPAPTPAPSSWDQAAATPQWGAPEADLREDLAAALDARMSAALPEPAVEADIAPEIAPEPSPIDIPPASDERLSALTGVFGSPAVAPEMAPPEPPPAPAPARDHISEWSRPAPQVEAEVPEEKKKGLFGFLKRDEPSHESPVVAHAAMTEAAPAAGRAGQLASLANALLGEYNSGQYGKGRLDDRMANLLMRVDEQADPIDRPLPIVDDRIDSQALDRENVPESQAVPYLAILVSQIYEDAEHTFGKDKAKKGYKAAQQQVFGSDASALSAPDVAGRLPRV